MSKDYNSTLNLPKTDFPMRASLPEREPQILKEWEEKNLYKKLLDAKKDKPKYILHDGPPYANGDIHMGHALNKLIKDFVLKERTMAGYQTPYVPGWDTHGLPIEQQAIKKLGIDSAKSSVLEFRKQCRDFALEYVPNQKAQFRRLGILGDWDNPYLTLNHEFEARQIELFGQMYEKGYIYKGLKPVYWCPHDRTALAEAEIEYSDDKCSSIYVKFRLSDDLGKVASKIGKPLDDIYFVIWTTTTWTLPGNVAISVNPNFDYSFVEAENGEVYVLAKELTDSVVKASGIKIKDTLLTLRGSELEYMKTRHPFIDRESLVITGEHVTLESGTGCVHTAPGHGVDDYVVCRKYKELPIIVPVDDRGYLTSEAGEFEGLYYDKANKPIEERLSANGALLAVEEMIHQYPHCWRCKSPIIFRATDQWFCSVEAFLDQTVKACETVEWIPAWGKARMIGMVKDRSDWCISRQRAWGVPIPAFYCEKCGKHYITPDTIKKTAEYFAEEGSDAWYSHSAKELLPEGFKCSCGCEEFIKETDIMDVWFDSGSSHYAVLESRDELSFPADLYLEGNDQYRGWFQSSLLTSIACKGVAPYKTVLTHGMIVDGEGKKMSKSLGNGIDPMDVVKEYGADVLRLWVASSDYRLDVRLSKDILKQISEAYRKIRNTARFILGNLNGYNPDTDEVPYEKLTELDRWALIKLDELIKKVRESYSEYEYHVVFHAIHNFCVVDMSNFYLDIVKDRLYVEGADSLSRKSAQTVIYKILSALIRLLSPIICFTAEEVWKFMPHTKEDKTESIYFNEFPEYEGLHDRALMDKWDTLLAVREDVKKALENARNAKVIGASLEANVILYCEGRLFEELKKSEPILASVFISSQAVLKPLSEKTPSSFTGEIPDLAVDVIKAPGTKCVRCWTYSETVGKSGEHPELCSRCAGILEGSNQ